jgi:hypothetical protein
VQVALERFINIGEALNWSKLENTMREGYKVAKQKITGQVAEDNTSLGTNPPVTSTGAA